MYKNYRTKNLNKSLNLADYIVLSPGISLIKNKKLRKFKKKIITDIDLLYLYKKNFKSIVVTGTNGKSTTCKLIEHLLKKNKLKCFLGGNIGTPVLNLENTKNSFIIIEASSFQLSHSKFIKPDFAFFLNLTNDHLDWHGNMNNYFNSKLKIFRFQNKDNFALINKKFKKVFLKKSLLANVLFLKLKNIKRSNTKLKMIT